MKRIGDIYTEKEERRVIERSYERRQAEGLRVTKNRQRRRWRRVRCFPRAVTGSRIDGVLPAPLAI